ncbi:MAG: T9SS type A sorting domain-containing protein [Balneola sp.]|jgi:hypothetical protein
MKRKLQTISSALLLALTLAFLITLTTFKNSENSNSSFVPDQEKSVNDRAENSQARREHFFRLTRSPHTNTIPKNIRSRELSHSKFLENSFNYKTNALLQEEISIMEAGPNDVGGRTRGLGVDSRNSDIILAGGASGGMWKSVDGGANWSQTSDLGENLGVTSLVQDPNNPDTWYYSTGEFSGASSRARGGGGQLYGSGIYLSNDNGDSWAQIPTTDDSDVSFNSKFDYISRVEISPTTGTTFFASNAIGVHRSTNNFVSSSLALGGTNQHVYSDVQVASDGVVIAAISRPFDGFSQANSSGVYISTNDGITWTDVTPATYPSNPGRAVIGVSESDPSFFYVFAADNSNQPTLFSFNISDLQNVLSFDRTDNIPNFGPQVGNLNLQGGYNMVCEVHPTDRNTVLIGGTNLFRSVDGFTSTPADNEDQNGNAGSDGYADNTEKNKFWIGGYAPQNNISQYPNHHPDQHFVVFDPNNADRVFSSHDGGISVTSNIKANTISWQDLNNGYNITQFYTVAIHPDAGDERILGGTQDNGSPFFEFSPLLGTSGSFDISSGDGAYAYLGENYLTTSSQRGRLIQYRYTLDGDPTTFSYIAPIDANNQLFIHPYLVNPNSENHIFYPAGNKLFRNSSATLIQVNQNNPNGTSEGWSDLTTMATPAGTIISTLAISATNPSNVLYYASYSASQKPEVYRLANANNSSSTSDLKVQSFTAVNSDSIPPAGAYIHDIAISEDNGNEIIAVVSNYSTESIYYSTNGGNTWTGIGGNLEPSNGNGPSVRTAAITKTASGEKTYFVGTSTGLYATNTIAGGNTEWKFQGASTIGNTVIEYLDYRPSDKTLAIATHGRGIFIGNVSMSVSNEVPDLSDIPGEFSLDQNYPNPFNPSTNISYSLPTNSTVNISVYDINGRKVADLLTGESKTAGNHTLSFDASNLASGVYLYRIDANSVSQNRSFSQIKRMTLIK